MASPAEGSPAQVEQGRIASQGSQVCQPGKIEGDRSRRRCCKNTSRNIKMQNKITNIIYIIFVNIGNNNIHCIIAIHAVALAGQVAKGRRRKHIVHFE